ncbi:MAG TPA: hypothetical protein VF691_11115 [Cytophagaceae bacterium]|jgi:hypothetical protein
MNILEKIHAIDTSLVKDESLLEELKGVIFEYDESDQDSVDNAHTIYEILIEQYPQITGAIAVEKETLINEPIEKIEKEEAATSTDAPQIKKKKKKKKKTKVDEVGEETAREQEGEKHAEQAPAKKKITQDLKGGCKDVITEIKRVLATFQGKKKPKAPTKKKALAVIVKESVVIIIKRVLEREKRVNPKKNVDVEKFKSVIEKGKDFLIALRKASGGISDENDQMITSFENQVNEILTVIETSQEKEAA